MEALLPQPCVSALIPLWPVAQVMADPVNLHDQPRRRAVEIDDAAIDRMLISKLEAGRSLSEHLPQ